MEDNADLFWDLTSEGFALDHRWDSLQNAELLNIVFVGGTFGNFLRYFLERFSNKTPSVQGDPFTDIGTSHKLKNPQFSGLIQRYHLTFMNDNEKATGLPVCLIMPSTDTASTLTKKHFLYMQQALIFRAGEKRQKPDYLWQKAIGEMEEPLKTYADSIIKLFAIKDMAHFSWLPKFIVRDWYKMSFLEGYQQTHHYKKFNIVKDHEYFKKQNTYHFPLEAFFDYELFRREIKALDERYHLDLDQSLEKEMKAVFMKGFELDVFRQQANLAVDVIEKNSDHDLRNLDVSTEAFIYAEMEKRHDFVQMPLTNRFFRDTAELMQFIECYPQHYKAMNPNMPEFNGIANPYYLKK